MNERVSEPSAIRPALSVGLGLGTILAALAVVPATLRLGASAGLFVILVGIAALFIAPAAAGLRASRPLPRSSWSVPLALALSLAPLALFARILIVATHHRPLGAATFALVAAILLSGAVAVSARLLVWSEKRASFAPLALGVLGLLAGAVLLLPALGSPLRGWLFDLALWLAAFVAAGALSVPASLAGLLRKAGLALWLVVVLVGLGAALALPDVRAALVP